MQTLSALWTGVAAAFKGVPVTLGVSAFGVVIGLALGLLLALARSSRLAFFRGLATVYTDVFRGTPLVVQALIMAYGIPVLINQHGGQFKWPHLIIPAMIVCGLNSAAYMSEIVRAGLAAVDKGQREAAYSLGMTHKQAMRLIIIPQAIRIILPPLGNEFITMIKETAVLSYVGVTEVLREGVLLSSRTFDFFTAYLGAAIVYLIFTIPLSKGVLYMERRLKTE